MRAFLLYSSLPVGGIAVCFLLGTYALLELSPSIPLLVLAFCAVFLVYQVERALHPAAEDVHNHPQRLDWVARHRRYVWVSTGVAFVGALVTLPWLQLETLGLGLGLALCSALYIVPLGQRQWRLKSVWYLKPLLIAGAWAVGGVLMPVLEAGIPIESQVVALVGYRTLFVLPNAFLADWPDRVGDAKAGLHTVATRLTGRQVRWGGAIVLIGALSGGLYALIVFNATWLLAVDLCGVLILLIVVLRPWPQTRWFFGFLLDLIIAWPGVTAVWAGLFRL